MSAEDRGCERDDNRAAASAVAPDADFQLMCVRRLLREAGEGTITERIFEGSCDQLVGYLGGRLDQ